MDIVGGTDSTAALVVAATGATDAVKTSLNAGTGYAIGVLSLDVTPGSGDTWKFVKLDANSPNFNLNGSSDTTQRQGLINGRYPFAMTAYAVTPTKPAKGSVALTNPALLTGFVNALKDPVHDLTGIGYFDGTTDVTKLSKVHRTNGNSCSPLLY